MIPHVTAVRMTGRKDRAELPLLVLGPSLGTSATTLWADCGGRLSDVFDVLAWDLPGHGHNRTVPEEPFTMSELAAGVLAIVDEVQYQRGDAGSPICYAGDSVGGAVGLQLLLDSPGRVATAALLGTAAKVGDEAMWSDRIEHVSLAGTAALAAQETVDQGYLQVCGALATFDVRDRLGEIKVPVLAVAGAQDVTTPPGALREIAQRVQHGTYAELDGVAHLAPAEAPAAVAGLLRRHFLGEEPALGADADLTREFQQFVTEHASGGIWARPGLDRRSRFLVTLTALVARGHHEELARQVTAARTGGVTVDEIKELLLQTAIHCGVPDATAAFRAAQQSLADLQPDPAEEHP